MLQYRTLYGGNMDHCTATKQAIVDMRNSIVRNKEGINVEDIEEEDRVQAENPSSIVLQLHLISDKIGVAK